MRLARLDLTRYGKFTDHAIAFGDAVPGTPDLHVVYGLNEAGKSTALSGYLDLLFGIEERTRYAFLHPYTSMEVGATLEFGGRRHVLKRVKQRTNSLRDGAGQPVNEALLGTALGGLAREAYRTMFSLDDQTLEDGGNAILDSKGDLGELLFSASAGLTGLSRTLDGLAAEADGIYRKQASKTQIAGLKRHLVELKTRRADIDVQASHYRDLAAALKRAEAAYEAAMAERADAKVRFEAIARRLRAHPLAIEHAQVGERLAPLERLPRPPEHWSADIPRLMTDEATLRTRLRTLDDQAARLEGEIAAITVDAALIGLGERLGTLSDAAARFRTAEDDLPKRRSALLSCEARIGALARSLLGRESEADPATLLVPAPLVGTLRDLIEERSGIDAALRAAEREVAAAEAARDAASDERRRLNEDGPAPDPGGTAALTALVARLRHSDVLARLRLAERDGPPRRRQFDDAVARLAPWRGGGDDLAALACPDAERIEGWKRLDAALETRRSAHRGRLHDLVTQERELAARIAAIEAGAGRIGDAEAASVRSARDAAWALHRAELASGSADRFERAMREADSVLDGRVAHAHVLAEWRGLATSLAGTRALVARERETLSEIDGETDGLSAAIRRAVPVEVGAEDGRPPGERLAGIERWARSRESALAAWTALRAAQRDLEDVRAEAERDTADLAAALARMGPADPDATTLAALLEAAEAVLTGAATRARAREMADTTLRDLAKGLSARQRASQAARAAREAWEARWQGALAGTWFSDRAGSTGAVREILDALTTLPAELRDRDDIRHRIDAMERDRDLFAAEVASLSTALGEDLDPAGTAAAATSLCERHVQATRDRHRLDEKEAARDALAGERARLSDDRAVHEARRTELLDFFGAADLAEVGAALARCGARDRLEAERAKLASRIVAELGAPSLDEALARLDGHDRAEDERDSVELAARIEDVDERLKLLFAERARAAEGLGRVGGDDAVARIDAERRTVLLQIEDLAVRYLRLKTGRLLAEQALRTYRDRHRSSMMRRASEAFRLITRGDYDGLAASPDRERETLIGLPRQGGSKLAADMSKGTRFQLYLALRLAGYEEFAAARPAVPFVADDIMETFDEPRSEEVFRLLGRMASIGQVIYFTHHRHLCEMASRVVPSARTHDLSG